MLNYDWLCSGAGLIEWWLTELHWKGPELSLIQNLQRRSTHPTRGMSSPHWSQDQVHMSVSWTVAHLTEGRAGWSPDGGGRCFRRTGSGCGRWGWKFFSGGRGGSWSSLLPPGCVSHLNLELRVGHRWKRNYKCYKHKLSKLFNLLGNF